MQAAFDQFSRLASELSRNLSNGPLARYLCALVSELSYHDIRSNELSGEDRAIILPCYEYNELVQSGAIRDVLQLLRLADFGEENSFLVRTDYVSVTGIIRNDLLLVGYRGTAKFFRELIAIDIVALPIRLDLWDASIGAQGHPVSTYNGGAGHFGFANEAARISPLVSDEITRINGWGAKQIYLAGHSLGGAVAGISERYLRPKSLRPISTFTFGAPRYCDQSAYTSNTLCEPVQVIRRADLVPFVVPQLFGFSDGANRINIDGSPFNLPSHSLDVSLSEIGSRSKLEAVRQRISSAFKLAISLFEPHEIEGYRKATGSFANIPSAAFKLLRDLRD